MVGFWGNVAMRTSTEWLIRECANLSVSKSLKRSWDSTKYALLVATAAEFGLAF